MERFVHNEYLIHLRKQLAGTTDEAKRPQTSTLLTEEEVKDHLPPKEKWVFAFLVDGFERFFIVPASW
jgi:hypothetical protein